MPKFWVCVGAACLPYSGWTSQGVGVSAGAVGFLSAVADARCLVDVQRCRGKQQCLLDSELNADTSAVMASFSCLLL